MSGEAWALAARQHGVITHADLTRLGFSRRAIQHRVARGRLHPMFRGVYAVGRPEPSREGRWMAAILACGEGAVLSHGSAAALWGIARERNLIEVSVRRRAQGLRRSVAGPRIAIRVRSRPALRVADTTERLGIPITSVVQTLLDLATCSSAAGLERAVNEADKRDLIDPEELSDALHGHRGRPGVRSMTALLDRDTFRLSDSDLEVLFRPIAASAGLPPPLSKQVVNGLEVDFYWPDLGLVVETDGLRYHRTPAAQARDWKRDQTHTAAGLSTLRFTHWQVRREAAYVEDTLRQTARLPPAEAHPSQRRPR